MFVEDKRQGEAVVEHPSRAGMIAFLETKDPRTSYHWNNMNRCACAQYAGSVDKYEDWLGAARRPLFSNGPWQDLNRFASTKRTFGDLLAILKADAE